MTEILCDQSNMEIFLGLRAEVKHWWWFSQLRAQGRTKQARELEHRSFADRVSTLREAVISDGFLTMGKGTWTLHYRNAKTPYGTITGKYEGYMPSYIPDAARIMGILVVDYRPMNMDRIFESLKLPIPRIGQTQPEGSGALDYIPPKDWARMMKELGATVYNLSE